MNLGEKRCEALGTKWKSDEMRTPYKEAIRAFFQNLLIRTERL